MGPSGTSHAQTEGIQVDVTSWYHPERSAPARGRWFFSYTVTIHNVGVAPVQLLARRWVITNAQGEQEVVTGPGVVGEQPHLAPGEQFTYTSFCPLDTSLGAMEGSYRLQREDGSRFEATIAPFTLADPAALN